MDFVTLFKIYYAKFRGESTPPDTTDPEWGLGISYYNDALQRMTQMDDTKWNFLYSTLQTGSGGTRTATLGTTSYAAPDDMQEPGGFVTLLDANNNPTMYPLLQPYEQQAANPMSRYAYFTGDKYQGFTMHLNPAPTSTEAGYDIDYVYYRSPELLEDSEDGTTLVEGADASFLYNHMLASRFLANKNFSSYQVAKRDAEEALKGMKLKNNSGSHYSAWKVEDTGGGWGY